MCGARLYILRARLEVSDRSALYVRAVHALTAGANTLQHRASVYFFMPLPLAIPAYLLDGQEAVVVDIANEIHYVCERV